MYAIVPPFFDDGCDRLLPDTAPYDRLVTRSKNCDFILRPDLSGVIKRC
jgi:hypothetical protein